MARATSKAGTTTEKGLVIERRFSTRRWCIPTTSSSGRRGTRSSAIREKPAFKQENVEFPKTWSQNATNIVAQKYFRGQPGSPERETSVKQMVSRVAGRIAEAGREAGYFATRGGRRRLRSRAHLDPGQPEGGLQQPGLVQRRLEGARAPSRRRPASSSSVEDDMDSILSWNTKEGIIFKGGSGSGINLSKIRGSMEPLSKGGIASGPVSFMRGADSWAGRDQVGRRHPPRGQDGRARRRPPGHREVHLVQGRRGEEGSGAEGRRLRHAPGLATRSPRSSSRTPTTRSGSPTSSWRPSRSDEDWDLIGRVDGEPIKTVKARELMDQIADAAWQCADPGIQYDTTINRWHTDPNTGPITASNPCSRVHVDRRLGLQSGLAQPDEVPQRGRHLQRRRLHPRGGHRLPRAGDPGRLLQLPDRADHRERAGLSASSASATPTSARC